VPLLIAFLAAVTLVSPFGEATGSAIDDSDGLLVEITVEYNSAAHAVIVRPYSDFQELAPTAMTPTPAGVWVAWVELPTAQNWQIAFEAFAADGTADLSEGTDLLALGVDPIAIDSEVVQPLPSKPLIPDGSLWLIIAVVFAVIALGVLALWVFSSDSSEDGDDLPSEEGEETSPT
jgi:hypothetical protein